MKKIFMILAALLICVQATAFAELHQTQVANVASINSAYSYKDPELLKIYTEKKLAQEAAKQNSNNTANDESAEKLVEPPTIFKVYVTNDRFYDKDDAAKYRERIDIGFTSHNNERNFIFDKKIAPYLLLDDGVNVQELHFQKFKFDNPYWISFSLTQAEISKINTAKKVTVVLPEAMENIYIFNQRKRKIEKQGYDEDMEIAEQSFQLPAHIVAEWKTVLNNR